LIWLIVGFGLFVHKSYRELFRLINSEVSSFLPGPRLLLAEKGSVANGSKNYSLELWNC
jgi:hypothetical protein